MYLLYVICNSLLVKVRVGANTVALEVWSIYCVSVNNILFYRVCMAGSSKTASVMSQV